MPEPDTAASKGDASLSNLTGTMVGRYAVRSLLGSGGMGEVYLAEDTRLKRSVAIKRIAPGIRADELFRHRFLREAENASRLNESGIAAIYDVLEERDEVFLVMEYVEGASLRQRLASPVGIDEFLRIARQCLQALAAAQEQGIVHHDLKPENIMLTPKGQVKILDFGVARKLQPQEETTISQASGGGRSGISGTSGYMAPEVLLLKKSDGRADVFSLGVVFYEMLGGLHPFRADSFVATCDRILHEDPPPPGRVNPEVPAVLDRVVMRALEKDPDARYASAGAMLAELGSLGEAVASPSRIPRTSMRWPGFAAAAVLLLVAAFAMVPMLEKCGGPDGPPGKIHLAVLPFETAADNPNLSAFSRGLVETLNARLTQLTRRDALQVVPASEIRQEDIRTAEQAHQLLGVNRTVEGSLSQSAGIIRATYAVVDAGSRRQLHAGILTVPAADPFMVLDEVAESVIRSLGLELQPQEQRAVTMHGTSQPDAYTCYLRGRGYLQEYHKPESIESAITAFSRAFQYDPRYALAGAGLGEAYWRKYELLRERNWADQALAACTQAADLMPSLAEAHECLGMVYNGTGRYEKAVEEFARATGIEPTSDEAFRGLARAYQALNRAREAEKTYLDAIRLRPQYWGGYSWLGAFYFQQGRYQDAAAMFDQVLRLAPESFRGYTNLGASYMMQGRYDAGISMFLRSEAIRPTDSVALSNLGTIFFLQRRFEESTRYFERSVELNRNDWLLWGNLADAYFYGGTRRARSVDAYGKALTLAEEALRVNPRDAGALGYAAYYHAMRNEATQAREALQRALGLAPDDLELQFNAALTCNRLGDKTRALECLEKALAAGYPASIVRNTAILDDLRPDPRFKRLLESY